MKIEIGGDDDWNWLHDQFLVKNTKIWSYNQFLVKITKNKRPHEKGLDQLRRIWGREKEIFVTQKPQFCRRYVCWWDGEAFQTGIQRNGKGPERKRNDSFFSKGTVRNEVKFWVSTFSSFYIYIYICAVHCTVEYSALHSALHCTVNCTAQWTALHYKVHTPALHTPATCWQVAELHISALPLPSLHSVTCIVYSEINFTILPQHWIIWYFSITILLNFIKKIFLILNVSIFELIKVLHCKSLFSNEQKQGTILVVADVLRCPAPLVVYTGTGCKAKFWNVCNFSWLTQTAAASGLNTSATT